MDSSAKSVRTLELPPLFDRSSVGTLQGEIESALEAEPDRILLDLGPVERFDSSGMALLIETLRKGRDRGIEIRLRGAGGGVLDFLSLLSVDRLVTVDRERDPRPWIVRLGAVFIPVLDSTESGLRLVGRAIVEFFRDLWTGKTMHRDRFLEEVSHAGNGGMGIVLLIGFLLGLILAMQAWIQLRVFGAVQYIADMVAVSVTREIGPLMAAILVAARSGSSIAAQLGTMTINEEVDALRQMGVHPMRYLVLPKMLALGLATPCLAILFCGAAILGGALFGILAVGIEPGVFLESTRKALKFADLLGCLLKAGVFGFLIASVGCSLGLNVKGGPEGVGRATTGAVVASIFLIIVFDAIFVLALRVSG